jgi:hypothetical protein
MNQQFGPRRAGISLLSCLSRQQTIQREVAQRDNVTLWPDERTLEPGAARLTAKTQSAEVVSIAAVPCRVPRRSGCRRVTVRVLSGPDEGTTAAITVGWVRSRMAILGRSRASMPGYRGELA